MLQMLINFIFNIILTIVQAITTPFFSVLFALFPSVAVYFSYISDFLTTGLTYVTTILRWFLFSPSMLILLFDYYVIKYTVHLTIQAVKFTINLYDKLKP